MPEELHWIHSFNVTKHRGPALCWALGSTVVKETIFHLEELIIEFRGEPSVAEDNTMQKLIN